MNRTVRWTMTIVIVALLAYAATKLDWPAIAVTARDASPRLLVAAIAVNLLSLAMKGVRWWIFLRAVGISSVGLAVRASFVGAGINNIMVANGGEAARVLLVARATGVSRASVLATLAIDRLFDPLCYLVLLLGAIWVAPLPQQLAHAHAIVLALLGLVLVPLIWLTARRSRVPDVATTSGWRARLRNFHIELGALASMPRMGGALLLSLAVWATQLMTFDLVARASGIDLPLAGNVAVLLLTNAGLIVRATPANVGYFQFAYALAAKPFGVPANAAIAAALLLQAVQIIPVTLLGLLASPKFIRRSSNA